MKRELNFSRSFWLYLDALSNTRSCDTSFVFSNNVYRSEAMDLWDKLFPLEESHVKKKYSFHRHRILLISVVHYLLKQWPLCLALIDISDRRIVQITGRESLCTRVCTRRSRRDREKPVVQWKGGQP